jgi:hypothetical protein
MRSIVIATIGGLNMSKISTGNVCARLDGKAGLWVITDLMHYDGSKNAEIIPLETINNGFEAVKRSEIVKAADLWILLDSFPA